MENKRGEGNKTLIKKYDVVYVRLTSPDGSRVQHGSRPAIVISNDIGNENSPTILCLPLTSRIKKICQKTHLIIRADKGTGLRVDSMLLAENIVCIDKDTVSKVGRIEDRGMQKEIFKTFIRAAAYGKEDADLMDLYDYSYELKQECS